MSGLKNRDFDLVRNPKTPKAGVRRNDFVEIVDIRSDRRSVLVGRTARGVDEGFGDCIVLIGVISFCSNCALVEVNRLRHIPVDEQVLFNTGKGVWALNIVNSLRLKFRA